MQHSLSTFVTYTGKSLDLRCTVLQPCPISSSLETHQLIFHFVYLCHHITSSKSSIYSLSSQTKHMKSFALKLSFFTGQPALPTALSYCSHCAHLHASSTNIFLQGSYPWTALTAAWKSKVPTLYFLILHDIATLRRNINC